MIVDCHTHISPPQGGVQLTAEPLETQQNVDKCIVLATPGDSAEEREESNERLSKFIAKFPEKMVGFAFVDPVNEGFKPKRVTNLTQKQGHKGLVVYCSACDFHPAHTRAMRLYEFAQEKELPVFFHNGCNTSPLGTLAYARPYLLDEIATKFPELKIIIGNMGYPFVKQTVSMVGKHPNVYADLTIRPDRPWQLYTTVITAFEHGIMDKLLFGSGFPSGNAAECIEALLGFNKRLGDTNLPAVPRNQLRKIIERESLKILGIDQ